MLTKEYTAKITSVTVVRKDDVDRANPILIFTDAMADAALAVSQENPLQLKANLDVKSCTGIQVDDDAVVSDISFKVYAIVSNESGDLIEKISECEEGYDYRVISCGIGFTALDGKSGFGS